MLPGTTWELCQHAIRTDGILIGLLSTIFMLLVVGAVSALYGAILFVVTKNFVRQRWRVNR